MKRRYRLLPLLFFALLATAPPLHADARRTIIVLLEGLTVDDLHDATLPHLRSLARKGAVGLMNTAVAGPPTDTAALLTLALGFRAPATPSDEEAYRSHSASVEGAPAGVVFQRRAGIKIQELVDRRGEVIVHLGIASLTRRGLNDKLVGAVLARAGKGGRLCIAEDTEARGPVGRAALLVIDAAGIGSCSIGAHPAVQIYHVAEGETVETARPDSPRTERPPRRRAARQKLDRLLEEVGRSRNARLLLLSPRPPLDSQGRWEPRLTPVILTAPDVRPGLLTSETTRTPGLISNVDIAPTLLRWLDTPIPPSMIGHPLSFSPASAPLQTITRLDRLVTYNAYGLVPVFVLLGFLTAAIGFGGLLALRLHRKSLPWITFAVLFLMNMPLAMLLVVPLLDRLFSLFDFGGAVHGVTVLTACVLIIMLLLACLESIPVRHGRPSLLYSSRIRGEGEIPSPSLVAAPLRRVACLTCAAILVDAFTGQRLVKFSLLSSYPLQGIRFYGIGNEYMGVLIGLTLLGAFLSDVRAWQAGVLFAFTAVVIGFPRLGANAGGLIAASTAFGCGWGILSRRSVTWKRALAWTLIGLGEALVLAALDQYLGPPSHIGGALQMADRQGYGYLLDIVSRKVLMNARILTHPAVLIALVCIVGFLLLTWRQLSGRLYTLFDRYSAWARGLPAAGYGALAAFLFNDSGIVAALFVFGAFLVAGVYFLFAEASISASGEAGPETGSS